MGIRTAAEHSGIFLVSFIALKMKTIMRAAHCFGTDMLDKIERAAAICRIDSMRIYSVDALVQHIADAYRKSKKIRNFILEKRFNCIIKYIEKNYPNIL